MLFGPVILRKGIRESKTRSKIREGGRVLVKTRWRRAFVRALLSTINHTGERARERETTTRDALSFRNTASESKVRVAANSARVTICDDALQRAMQESLIDANRQDDLDYAIELSLQDSQPHWWQPVGGSASLKK